MEDISSENSVLSWSTNIWPLSEAVMWNMAVTASPFRNPACLLTLSFSVQIIQASSSSRVCFSRCFTIGLSALTLDASSNILFPSCQGIGTWCLHPLLSLRRRPGVLCACVWTLNASSSSSCYCYYHTCTDLHVDEIQFSICICSWH